MRKGEALLARALTVWFLLCPLFGAGPALGDIPVPTDGGSLPADYDCAQEAKDFRDNEDLFGPGNQIGVSGNMALTAGFGYAGELTVLRWPTPSYSDQIRYLTPFLGNACQERKRPHNGARDNMGSFAGLYVETAGAPGRMIWFRDQPLVHTLRYRSPDSAVLVTESTDTQAGFSVTAWNFVTPAEDVLVRHYRITLDPDSRIARARAVYYENLQIVTGKIPYLPLKDGYLEASGDFAVLYHAGRDALVHFRPQHPDFSLLPAPDTPQPALDAWIDGLDGVFPYDPADTGNTPTYFAVGADFAGPGDAGPASDAHQCGAAEERSPERRDLGAYWDSADGALQGNSASSGDVDGALLKDVDVSRGSASFTVYFAAAETASGALRLLSGARAAGFEALMEETEAAWRERMRQVRLPDTDDPQVLAVCKRALISLLQACTPATGAFSASNSTQPPYAENWPRDGFYMAHMMDVAGLHPVAGMNELFNARTQRRCDDPASPQHDVFCALEPLLDRRFGWKMNGTYDMEYYSDHVPGGPIFYELDNAGLAAFSLWDHARFLSQEDRLAYLCGRADDPGEAGIYPAIRRTADSLAACITPGDESGLPCYAFEDDNPALQQTVTGASAVYLALEAALSAGALCGERREQLDAWEARRRQLFDAIETHLWDPAAGHYVEGKEWTSSYLVWPASYPMPPERHAREMAYLFDGVKAHLSKEAVFNRYVGKPLLALLKHGWDSGDPVHNVAWAVDVLLREVPTPLWHYGENYLAVDTDGDGRADTFSNRQAVPHNWEGALAYLCAMAYYGEKPPQPGPPAPADAGGCGCSQLPGAGQGGGGAFLNANLLLLALPWACLRLARRSRSARGAGPGERRGRAGGGPRRTRAARRPGIVTRGGRPPRPAREGSHA